MNRQQKATLKIAFGALFIFGAGYAVGKCGHEEDLARRKLYLNCLHEYALGAVLGDEESDRFKAQKYCASIAGINLRKIAPKD